MKLLQIIKSIPQGAKSFAHAVRTEYTARRLADGLDEMEKAQREYARMSLAEQLQAQLDTETIQTRAQELRVQRAAKRNWNWLDKRNARRAQREKRDE